MAVLDHAFNPSTPEAEAEGTLSSNPACLVYTVSSKTANALKRDLVSKKEKEIKTKKKKEREREGGRKGGKMIGIHNRIFFKL